MWTQTLSGLKQHPSSWAGWKVTQMHNPTDLAPAFPAFGPEHPSSGASVSWHRLCPRHSWSSLGPTDSRANTPSLVPRAHHIKPQSLYVWTQEPAIPTQVDGWPWPSGRSSALQPLALQPCSHSPAAGRIPTPTHPTSICSPWCCCTATQPCWLLAPGP